MRFICLLQLKAPRLGYSILFFVLFSFRLNQSCQYSGRQLAFLVRGPPGKPGRDGVQGSPGRDGQDGRNGSQGARGIS